MTLKEMQVEIIANRVRRGFPSASDLSKTTKGLEEELGEWKDALAAGDMNAQKDALTDLAVFCLGGMEILRDDMQAWLDKVIEVNKTRSHKKVH